MSNLFFPKYLYSFLENQFGNLEKISAKITDIEPELLYDFVADASSPFTIVIVKEDDFARAVEIRNNPRIVKIVLLSVGNADFVDSLKDFEPYSIIPERFDEFKSIIEKVFDLQIEQKQSDYLEAILSDKKVSLEIILQYIQNSIENGGLSNKLLNENLNLLRYWKMSSEFSITELRKSIKNSSEFKIERQMKKAYKDTVKFKKIKNFSKISECILHGNFSEILNIAYWEDVKNLMVTKNSKIDDKKDDDDESKTYSNSFEYIFDNLDKFHEIEMLEANMQEDAENYEDVFCDYKSSQRKVEFFDELERKLPSLILSEDKRNILSAAANRLEESYKVFCDRKVTPKELNRYCELSADYLKNYLSLVCLVISDTRIAKCFNQHGLAKLLQSFNLHESNNIKEIDSYHPISVCFFHNLRRHYCDGLRAINDTDEDSYERYLILLLINKYLPTWPTEYFIFDIKKYIATGFLNQPIGQAILQPVSGASSLELIDFRAIAKIVTEFCNKKRMLNEYNIAIVGAPQIQNMQAFFESLNSLFVIKDLLIEKIVISFICNDESQIKGSIANIYKNGSFSEKILFKFCKVDKWKENGWSDDLTIFLDASILYEREKFMNIYIDKNVISGAINKSIKEADLASFLNNELKLVRIIWDTLQNVSTENNSDLVLWQNSELRNEMLDKILETVKDSGKEVCILSKNMNLLDEINLPTVQTTANIFPVGRKNILKVIFSKGEMPSDNVDNEPTISINFNNFLIETVSNWPSEIFAFSDLDILSFKFHENSVKFIYQCDDLDEIFALEKFLEIIFHGKTSIEKCFRKDFIQFIRNNSHNVNQMALCYVIDNYCPEKIKIEQANALPKKLETKQVPYFANYATQIIFDKIFNGIGNYDEPDEWDIDIIRKIHNGASEFPDIYGMFVEKLETFFNVLKDRGIKYD